LQHENGRTPAQIAAFHGHVDAAFTLATYVSTRDVGSADDLDAMYAVKAAKA
jgi:hypothetical protein